MSEQKNNSFAGAWLPVLAAVMAMLLGGCSKDLSDLEEFRDTTLAKSGGRIPPLPQIPPYESYTYPAGEQRSPFQPDIESARFAAGTASGSAIRPDANRKREFLEEFPLDSLRMVGTLNIRGELVALVRDPDGLIHQVRSGDFAGQNHGRIIALDDSEIRLVEIISDGLGGWIERPAAIALSE